MRVRGMREPQHSTVPCFFHLASGDLSVLVRWELPLFFFFSAAALKIHSLIYLTLIEGLL